MSSRARPSCGAPGACPPAVARHQRCAGGITLPGSTSRRT
jgi:hypothetical protein